MYRGGPAVLAAIATLTAILAGSVTTTAMARGSADGCRISGGFSIVTARAPAQLTTPLEPSLLAGFAVLRRPAAPEDAVPPLSTVGDGVSFELAGYYPSYTRRLLTVGSSRFYMFPAYFRSVPVPPAACLPKGFREHRAQLVEAERRRASEPVDCIVAVGPHPRSIGGLDECEPFAAADTAPRVFRSPVTAGVTVELVPDGVASVRVTRPQGSPQLAAVSENAFALAAPAWVAARVARFLKHNDLIPSERFRRASPKERDHLVSELARRYRALERSVAPRKVEWLDTSGNVMRTIVPASAGALVRQESIVGVNINGEG